MGEKVDESLAHRLAVDILAKLGDRDRIVVGIAGAQGSGKSTLACNICGILAKQNIDCAVVSLDDFYLTKHERNELATSVHPLLATRGVPGTHDTECLFNTIISLKVSKSDEVRWPRFSKKIDDRAQDRFNEFKPSFHTLVILLEGWCVGCAPLSNINNPINSLEELEDTDGTWRRYIDSQIRTAYTRIWELIDFFVYMHVPDWSIVRTWRADQAISNGEDIAKLNLDRFLQFFERISKQMMKGELWHEPDIEVKLGIDHLAQSVEKRL